MSVEDTVRLRGSQKLTSGSEMGVRGFGVGDGERDGHEAADRRYEPWFWHEALT